MAREFIMTAAFDRLWNSLGLNDNDLRSLQNKLIENPYAGDVIQGTSGARKVRFALNNIGKSGGARVIYANIANSQELYLLLCYSKGQQDDLNPEQKKQIKMLVQALKGARNG